MILFSFYSDIANIFSRDDDDSEDNMYLNAAGIDDDINGLMNCHRLDMSSVDDCNVLVEPKQEYLEEEENTAHPKIEVEHDDDQDNGCVEDDEHRLDHDHERLGDDGGNGDGDDSDDDDDSSLNAAIPGITEITGGGHVMDDEDEDDPGMVGDYKPQLIEMRDEDLVNGGLVDDRGSSNGGETINADVRELYANPAISGSGGDEDQQHETMCQLCATVFKTRYNLLRHFQKRHPEYKMYECDLCRISFPSIDEFKDHLEEKHSKVHTTHAIDSKQVRFACDVCGNMYKNKASAMNHLLTHTAKKTVRCEHCDFTCYTKQQLGVHQTKHDKRFVCEICHKRFAQKSQLDVHVNAVHYNQRPFACVLCKKTFKTKGSHDAHMIVHTDTRNYQCPHCDKKCRKRYDLTLHIRTHTGEKPFKCSVCGRGFVQMCDTRKHEMLHFKPGKRKSFFFSSPEPEENVIDDE